jgi:hypothetical protein
MKFGIFYELQLPRACESASVTELTPFSRDLDT